MRDRGVTNEDAAGLASLGGPPPALAPPVPAAPPPMIGGVPVAPRVPASEVPLGGPPPGMGMPAAAGPAWSTAPTAPARAGIPWPLALAVILASFPAVALLGMGVLSLLVGNDASSYDGGYYDSDPYGSYESASFTSEVNDFGTAASGAGAVMVVIGGAVLAFALLAAAGNNVGRIVTACWLALASVYLLSQVADAPSGAGGYLAAFIAPPIIAVIGLFSPSANRVFQRA